MDNRLQGQSQARARWNTQDSGAVFDRKKQSFLSTEAQEFLAQRAMCVIGARDAQGTVAGRLLFGWPGFARSSEASSCLLTLDTKSASIDLIAHLRKCRKRNEAALFFIDHATRQRLCIHGKAEILTPGFLASRMPPRCQRPHGLRLYVEQAFFHCPKYIRTTVAGLTTPAVVRFEREQLLDEFRAGTRQALSPPVGDFLRYQVTCFLCTVSQQGICAINHRGGAAGFLVMLPPDEYAPGGRLLLPDYKGNGAFEAIGNIFETGHATLVIPDYSARLALIIAGIGSILEPGELSPDLLARCKGAERVISLQVQHIVLQSGDWPLSG